MITFLQLDLSDAIKEHFNYYLRAFFSHRELINLLAQQKNISLSNEASADELIVHLITESDYRLQFKRNVKALIYSQLNKAHQTRVFDQIEASLAKRLD